MSTVAIGLAVAAVVAAAVSVYQTEAEKKMHSQDLAFEEKQNGKNSGWTSSEREDNNLVSMQQYESSIQTRKIEEGQSYETDQFDGQSGNDAPTGGGIYGPNRLS